MAQAGITLHSGDVRTTMARAERLAAEVRDKDYPTVRALVSQVTASP